MRRSYKGLYRPINPNKYVGDVNKIVYRSLLEKKFMLQLDNNPDVTYWASEELAIRYYNPVTKKYHRYFPDFIVRTSKGAKILIEIKPSRQCKPPKPPKKKSRAFMRDSFEYIKNRAKWQAATKYADDNNATFKIITEKDLGSY
jgi:hypothetical protein